MPIQPAINKKLLLPDSYLRVLKNCYWAAVGEEKAPERQVKISHYNKGHDESIRIHLANVMLALQKKNEELKSVAVWDSFKACIQDRKVCLPLPSHHHQKHWCDREKLPSIHLTLFLHTWHDAISGISHVIPFQGKAQNSSLLTNFSKAIPPISWSMGMPVGDARNSKRPIRWDSDRNYQHGTARERLPQLDQFRKWNQFIYIKMISLETNLLGKPLYVDNLLRRRSTLKYEALFTFFFPKWMLGDVEILETISHCVMTLNRSHRYHKEFEGEKWVYFLILQEIQNFQV